MPRVLGLSSKLPLLCHFFLYRRKRSRNSPTSIHATMTSFAIFIPDWNSLDSVRRAHSNLELAALVFFALLVLFDVLAHFSEGKKREKLLERIGLCFFAIAVVAELAAYKYGQRNDTLSEQLIGSLDTRARQASSDASKALTDSGTALSQAEDALSKTGAAEGAMKNATNEASSARTAASNALTLASGARREADSFEKDIVSAKTQAAEAESHFADASREAAEAREELNRLKTPRSLINASDFATALQGFKGTEYTFSSVFADEESIDLLKEIDSALQLAGWKRVKPSPGFPSINVYGKDVDFSVVSSLQTGIHISIDSSEPVASLKSMPDGDLPAHIRAATNLSISLSPHLSPPQKGIIEVNVEQGTSATVRIAVGKKP